MAELKQHCNTPSFRDCRHWPPPAPHPTGCLDAATGLACSLLLLTPRSAHSGSCTHSPAHSHLWGVGRSRSQWVEFDLAGADAVGWFPPSCSCAPVPTSFVCCLPQGVESSGLSKGDTPFASPVKGSGKYPASTGLSFGDLILLLSCWGFCMALQCPDQRRWVFLSTLRKPWNPVIKKCTYTHSPRHDFTYKFQNSGTPLFSVWSIHGLTFSIWGIHHFVWILVGGRLSLPCEKSPRLCQHGGPQSRLGYQRSFWPGGSTPKSSSEGPTAFSRLSFQDTRSFTFPKCSKHHLHLNMLLSESVSPSLCFSSPRPSSLHSNVPTHEKLQFDRRMNHFLLCASHYNPAVLFVYLFLLWDYKLFEEGKFYLPSISPLNTRHRTRAQK